MTNRKPTNKTTQLTKSIPKVETKEVVGEQTRAANLIGTDFEPISESNSFSFTDRNLENKLPQIIKFRRGMWWEIEFGFDQQ